MNNLLKKIQAIETMRDMDVLLNSKYARCEKDFKVGATIVALNKMDRGTYSYVLSKPVGDIDHPEFEPYFSPKKMLELGIFEGKYLNDCVLEYPREWFLTAMKKGTLSPVGPDIECNYFKIKSRMSLQDWIAQGWIPQIPGDPDNRGWFQWFCRYWLGRRIPEIDEVQIKRWKAFKRHYGQVKKNCDDLDCRPKQRQALLQWSYNAFVTSTDE